MCGGFPLCPEKLAYLTRCEEILIKVRGTWPDSGVVSPVGMLNFPDKPSCYLLVGFTIWIYCNIISLSSYGGVIRGSDRFFSPDGDIL